MEGDPNLEKANLIAELQSLIKEAYKRDLDGTAHKIHDFIGKYEVNVDTEETVTTGLKKKYPNYTEYEMYHVLSGSTPPIPSQFFDFPGDDSLEKFIRNL